VRDKDARVIQNVSGTMMFMRPGKFRWEYQKPYEQIIVGDGEKLWVHDPELNQVTVKTLDQAMGDTPAALLAGSREIESSFVLKDLPDRGEMHWLEAIPKTPEGAFEKIRIGFHGNDLETMELDDHFYQTTVILFSGTEPNLRLPSSLFHFTPPVGADVISD
jgi:outer membrane lipoprotein carrier protein